MKMKPCAVPSCQSLKYGLFSFPKNPAVILKWLESLNMDSHKAGDKICKEHFNADQYYINKDSCRPYRLIQNSVPLKCKISEHKGQKNNQQIVNKHVTDVHEGQKYNITNLFQCGKCSQKFSNPEDYKEHLKTVHKVIKHHKCEICSKSYSTALILELHSTSIHGKTPMDPLKEDRIESNLGKTDDQTMNFSEFNIKNPFKCGNCGQKFSKTKYLSEHMRKFHKEQKILSKNYKCQTCGKAFGSPYNLETHAQIHAINMHIKDVHEGQKDYKYNIINPFKCGKCNQKFSTAEELKDHLKAEHELYNCNECGKSFGQLQMLNQHTKSVHDVGIKHNKILGIKHFSISATNLFKCGK